MKVFTDMEKRAIYKDLATLSRYEVAKKYGLDKYYKKKSGMVSYIDRIYKEVLNNRDRFAIGSDLIEMVEDGLKNRATLVSGETNKPYKIDKTPYEEMELKELVEGASNKLLTALNLKLDFLLTKKKALDQEKIGSLALAAAQLFDKRRIIQGEATEHIALKAKIDKDMTPQEKIELVMKIREQTINQ